MIKAVLVALWVCGVTAGGLYLTQSGIFDQKEATPVAKPGDTVQTKIIAVPVLSDGSVTGYFLSRIQYSVGADGNAPNLPFDAVLRHALHAAVNKLADVDFREDAISHKESIEREIAEYVTGRLGMSSIQAVTIDDIDFLLRSNS